ncbi:MAG TPA: SusC/RagA family TonB-linked outer membrane protein, partial [Cyclobacteriaceae bacterium]
ANPYRSMVYNSMNANNKQRWLGNAYLQIEPIKNLTFRSTVNVDYETGEGHSYLPVYVLSMYSFNRINKASQNMYKNRTIIVDNLLSYGLTRGDHRVDIMLGTSAYSQISNSMNISNTNVVFDNLSHAWINSTTNKDGTRISIGGGPGDPNKRLSYFGRLNYNFKETFLLNATFRADASSNFAPGHQWGYFPSVSGGWIMTNSQFLGGTKNWLDFLKLRASWGQVGNQNVGAFQYTALIQSATTNYTFGPTEGANGLTPGAYNKNITNVNLKWESAQQSDIGFDARLFDGKVSVNFDWYNRTQKNWLVHPPLLATAGAEAPWVNGGNVTNKGIELAISYNNSIGDLNYHISVNGTHNKNLVTDVPTADGIIHPDNSSNQLWNNAPEFYRAQAGRPMGYFWGLKTNGIFQSEADVTSYTSKTGEIIQPNAKPGDVRYVDVDGNGVINNDDKTMIGNPYPKLTYGFSIGADYKGFDISILANGVAGNDLVQSYRNSGQADNYSTEMLGRWHGAGTSNRLPLVTEDNRNLTGNNFSDLYIKKGDFLRISNVTIGYNLSKIWKNKFASQCRIYGAALNLYTFTKYSGMDPEVGYSPDNLTQGVDLGYYPRPRTYMVGVNVKF